jgi:hypothetical protein
MVTGCWASAGKDSAAQGCAILEQKLRQCMDAPVRCSEPSRTAIRVLTTTARSQPEEEQHQLPPVAHVPQHCRPSQAEVSAPLRSLYTNLYITCISLQEPSDCTITRSFISIGVGIVLRYGKAFLGGEYHCTELYKKLHSPKRLCQNVKMYPDVSAVQLLAPSLTRHMR